MLLPFRQVATAGGQKYADELECQEKLVPSHCRAKNKQLKAPSNRTIPKGSRCFNFSVADKSLKGSSLIFKSRFKKTRHMTTAPIGKLLQI